MKTLKVLSYSLGWIASLTGYLIYLVRIIAGFYVGKPLRFNNSVISLAFKTTLCKYTVMSSHQEREFNEVFFLDHMHCLNLNSRFVVGLTCF